MVFSKSQAFFSDGPFFASYDLESWILLIPELRMGAVTKDRVTN